MAKRLRIFRFHEKVVNPDRTLPACACCFANFVLQTCKEDAINAKVGNVVLPLSSSASIGKRPAQSPTGSTPDPKRGLHTTWTIDEVAGFLRSLGLGHVESLFRNSAIDGRFLGDLSVEDLIHELGLTKLQAIKVKSRLP